ESDKASMDIPASAAGRVVSVAVSVGDKVAAGDLVLTYEPAAEDARAAAAAKPAEDGEAQGAGDEAGGPAEDNGGAAPAATARKEEGGPGGSREGATHAADLVVIGAGPGGYTAAFRAADLGLSVIL